MRGAGTKCMEIGSVQLLLGSFVCIHTLCVFYASCSFMFNGELHPANTLRINPKGVPRSVFVTWPCFTFRLWLQGSVTPTPTRWAALIQRGCFLWCSAMRVAAWWRVLGRELPSLKQVLLIFSLIAAHLYQIEPEILFDFQGMLSYLCTFHSVENASSANTPRLTCAKRSGKCI